MAFCGGCADGKSYMYGLMDSVMAVFAGSWGVLFPMRRIGKSLSGKFGKDGLACFCRVAVLFCDFIKWFLFLV